MIPVVQLEKRVSGALRVIEKVCPECKRKFEWFGEQWVYKGSHKGKLAYWCSWTCWRADERKNHKLRGEGYRDYRERQRALHGDNR